MVSIREKLLEICRKEKQDTTKTLAEELLKNYDANKFLSMKNLSLRCSVSESQITQFSKIIGYSGYRELVLRMKIEFETYYEKQLKAKNISINENFHLVKNTIIDLINYVDVFKDDVIGTAELLKGIKGGKSNVFLLSSYQNQDIATYFNQWLINNKINTIFNVTRAYDFDVVPKLNENDIIFLLVSGQDNHTIHEIYKKAIKKTKKIVVVTSLSHVDKFDKFLYRMFLDHKGFKSLTFEKRHLYLWYVINQLILNINT
ncbi:hypothetical protein NPX79_00075 [Spiroplasma endosymbiont of Anurida maritima]|uniref:hypothetical protein n=1 Tax=Spiroplasma endosymbiont of Anurida maritima TaxID=2967972 RepID=UPI0036D28802